MSASRSMAAMRPSRSWLGESAARTATSRTTPSGAAMVVMSVRHVHEAAVVTLEGDRDVRRRAVAVLDQHDVGLAGPRGLLLVHVFSVNHHDHIRILFN